jgi:hypothetical protein
LDGEDTVYQVKNPDVLAVIVCYISSDRAFERIAARETMETLATIDATVMISVAKVAFR